MPLSTLYLISLSPSTSLLSFLQSLHAVTQKSSPQHIPLILSKPIRWIITPETIDTDELLLRRQGRQITPSAGPADSGAPSLEDVSTAWDLLYIHAGTDPLPSSLSSHMASTYTLTVGIPSRMLQDFTTVTNPALLHPDPRSSQSDSLYKPPQPATLQLALTPTAQPLTLSQELHTWILQFTRTRPGQSAISMLNLLSFHPDRKKDYLVYGKAFAETIGRSRGGNAKLVGHVFYPSFPGSSSSSSSSSSSHKDEQDEQDEQDKQDKQDTKTNSKWHEFALAHYPSVSHFAHMLAAPDYQRINAQYRLPSLQDTCILCTSEIEIEDLLASSSSTASVPSGMQSYGHGRTGSKL